MPPKFLYFDLGNVLLYFDHRRAARQMAEVAGVTQEQVWDALWTCGLQLKLEAGLVSPSEFYEAFCAEVGTRPDFEALSHAASDMFRLNVSIVPLVAALAQARYRMGILSNTSLIHWSFYSNGRFTIVPALFEVVALSFELKALKPEGRIYRSAAELAGVRPEEIFFVDDTAGHVQGAKDERFDALQYTDTPNLAAELRRRGVRFNY